MTGEETPVLAVSAALSRSWENYAIAGVAVPVCAFIGAVLIAGASADAGAWGWAALGVVTIVGGVLIALAHLTTFVRVDSESVKLRWFPPTKTIPLSEVQSVTLTSVGVTTKCPTLILANKRQVQVMALVSYPPNAEKRRQRLADVIEQAQVDAE